ncbi:PEP-CTERM sorting domain-containing protein [Nostoc sp. UHCC 0702]|nr:PEP-CTERM sorting domain-containing protein [Nostoc sp. UHCC 0702]
MKLVPQLVLVAAGFAVGFATVNVKSASAAIINYTFTVESPLKRGNGFFSFDDLNFNNEYNQGATVNSLSFKFDDDSNIYTEQDDLDYPDFPIVYLTDFSTGKTSLALNYLFDDKANPASSLRYEIAGEDFTIFSAISSDVSFVSGRVRYTKVPEPTTLISTILACSFGLMVNQKTKLIKKLKV